MKRLCKLSLIIICVLVFMSAGNATEMGSSSSYDIAAIYEKIELESGSKVQNSYGRVDDAKVLFVPTKIDTGKYRVELTKIETNFYQICGTKIVIETKYCHEYASREEVILNITSNYGYTRGEVIFLD